MKDLAKVAARKSYEFSALHNWADGASELECTTAISIFELWCARFCKARFQMSVVLSNVLAKSV